MSENLNLTESGGKEEETKDHESESLDKGLKDKEEVEKELESKKGEDLSEDEEEEEEVTRSQEVVLSLASPATNSTDSINLTPQSIRHIGSRTTSTDLTPEKNSDDSSFDISLEASPVSTTSESTPDRNRSSTGSSPNLLRQIGRASISPQSEGSSPDSVTSSYVIVSDQETSPIPVNTTSNVAESTPTRASGILVRARAFSAIIPRHPSTKGLNQPSSLLKAQDAEKEQYDSSSTDRMKRRASHDGHSIRNRASLSAIALSPIPDIQDDSSSTGQSVISLDPGAISFDPNSSHPLLGSEVTFDYIVLHGKNEFGDLTTEARIALKRLGLRVIPAMHGPTSLPYARCPSGIDAFLFSPHKGDDPYTFILEPDQRKVQKPGRGTAVPLPGNARYSQASHLSNYRGKNRVVSAPEFVDEKKEKIFSSNRPRFFSGSKLDREVSNTSTVGDDESILSNMYMDPYGEQLYGEGWTNSHPHEIPESTFDQDSYTATTLPSPAYPTQHHYAQAPYVYPWSAYSNPYYSGYAPPPPPPATTSYYQPVHPYVQGPVRIPTIVTTPFNDPAVLSYAHHQHQVQQQVQQQQQLQHQHQQHQQQQQTQYVDDGSESFQTAFEGDEEDEEEEAQNGGFFFPVVAPQSRGQYRRDSISSMTTTVPSHAQMGRRRSIVSPVKLETTAGHHGRRNSTPTIIPTLQRRKSNPSNSVTVAPTRRFSIASHQPKSEIKLIRQPRAPPAVPTLPQPLVTTTTAQSTLVPHRSRPQFTTANAPIKVAPSTIKTHSRTSSRGVPNDTTSVKPVTHHHQHYHRHQVRASTSNVEGGKPAASGIGSLDPEDRSEGSSRQGNDNRGGGIRGRGRARRGKVDKVEKST